MELEFKAKVEVEIDYDSEELAGHAYDSRLTSAEVAYKAVLETREWGIKDLSFIAQPQELAFFLNFETAEDIETLACQVKLTKVEVENPTGEWLGSLRPRNLSVVLKNLRREGQTVKAEAEALLSF